MQLNELDINRLVSLEVLPSEVSTTQAVKILDNSKYHASKLRNDPDLASLLGRKRGGVKGGKWVYDFRKVVALKNKVDDYNG